MFISEDLFYLEWTLYLPMEWHAGDLNNRRRYRVVSGKRNRNKNNSSKMKKNIINSFSYYSIFLSGFAFKTIITNQNKTKQK